MIIKFEVNCGAWQVFDGVDSLQYRKLGAFALDLDDPEEILDFTETISVVNSDLKGNSGRVLMAFTDSKRLGPSRMIAFSPIYLMNNDGRTVETI